MTVVELAPFIAGLWLMSAAITGTVMHVVWLWQLAVWLLVHVSISP